MYNVNISDLKGFFMITETKVIIHGFRLLKEEYIEEQQGTLHQYIYDKTGTRLCWLDNKNSNKLFSITFKTIPSDDTGVFHILEHTVLCGSEKYPVKEPFVDLLRGSLNTFLNAMTFSDKTMYPVSSRNGKDFLNLVSVYLDAVFRPKLLTNKNIFLQEGWHYEFSDEGLIYNGVVYNEMKGAMDGPDSIEEQGMLELLFPDTNYRFNSGGDPSRIPELTYEQYVDTYKRYYHPSNCNIYVDGDADIDALFSLLDSYLCGYDRLGRACRRLCVPVLLQRAE